MNFQITPIPTCLEPATWFIWNANQLMLQQGQFPQSVSGLTLTNRRFIGMLDDQPCCSAELLGPAPEHAEWCTLRQALNQHASPAWQQALSRARQLSQFDHEHQFCSACASPLKPTLHDQGKQCPSCNTHYYPKLSPAMMVCIKRGRDILLARAAHFAPGVYSALAGFVEPGETLEQCVHRETMEEVGVSISHLQYARSQSWPFPHSLMLAFVADYVAGDITPQAGEIEDAQWFSVDKLPELPSRASIAWWLIQHTRTLIEQATS